MTKSNTARICLLATAFAAATASSAAAIECNEDYQIVQGRPISTPFCRDNYLAAVARTYGYKVSDATIRNNPSRKEEICRYIGSDIRVQTACEEVLPGSRDTR
ncbi:hypothetical protein [Hyphomicrobium facile]|uniref:HdeA/HdeB family protein n=1 Tax=Hyphomicrobium facile TaxID=51670 RepID=A0A1I7MTL1_9HYPH|nr:hypothetical protein [Hyphomicrobium facile]SFV25737.1 hypothetical protein SAMN04488557_0076 [Hyphomicrobium facile]